MGEILVSQEFVQVEWADRLPSVLVSQEFVQVEYIPMDHGTKNLGAIINGVGDSVPEYAYIESKREFEYFDAQVDFTVMSGIISSRCGIEMAFEIDDDNRFYIRAGNKLNEDSFLCDFREAGLSHYYTTPCSLNYGKIRIARYAGIAKVYYKEGNATTWTEWVSYNGFPETKGNILLGFYSANESTPSGSLDNFRINNESGCSTCYFFDNFYGNSGDLYNQDLWTGSTSNIEIKNNKLHMLYSNVYTYVSTKYIPAGDFNVQVDFSIGSYQSYSTWAVYLHVFFKNGDRFGISYQYDTSSPYLNYHTTSYVNSVWTTHAKYGSDTRSGKFRITRKGNTFSSYFLIGDKWFHFYDWHLEEETEIDYIRLARSSWSSVPSVECYFDNFKINDDFDFYNDVRIDGNYSQVDGNYIKLEGGNVHTNKAIRSANAITFEWSVTVEEYSGSYSVGFVVCNTPFRSSYGDHSGESIYIMYYAGCFKLWVDGYEYDYILDGDHRLFYPVYGQPYIIGIKFIPGTGTVIYWQGPTNGYLVFDYIINGDLYSWWGNMYGKGTYGNQVTTVHRFRCFEDKPLYKELIGSWLQSVGADDEFLSSDGSSPSNDRWNVTGSPKIYNHSLKIIEQNGDKIQSKTCFCAPFEVILDYSGLCFGVVEGAALSLNIESYDTYRDRITGTSKFKVGYNGGVGCWVNYYCGDSSGNSSIYHTSNVGNRKLKIINDGYKIQYLLSDGVNWVTIESLNCNKQHYYRVLVEGTEPSVVFYIDSISFGDAELLSPTDAVCLVPTAWRFSPTDKAYQCITYVPLNNIIGGRRHFSVDSVAKINNSMFLSYIELDKDLVIFDGAIVVGDTHSTLTSAIDAAKDGQVIYILPGSYNLNGYTITKKILIVGVGDYGDINIIIAGSSVKLDGSVVVFKNITILEQLPSNNIAFRTQGSNTSYFTMDNCKYTSSNNNTEIFKIEGSSNFYVYLRRSYINHNGYFAYTASGYPDIYFDILNCRILRTPSSICSPSNGYQMRSMIYSNSSRYEPESTDSVPVLTLFSPNNDTNIYLNTPKGMEKKITCNSDVFNYLSFGNCPGGVVFYGGKNDYYFSDYLMPPVDESYKLFIQGYIDTTRVFNSYQTYEETLNNISTVGNLGLNLSLAHNGSIVEYKIYEPLNIYNSSLYLGQGTQSVVDEFIWSKVKTTTTDMAAYYNSYLEKLGFLNCNIYIDNTKYKFFIDFGSNIGVGSLIQSSLHNFTNTVYYSDDVSDPALLNTTCSLLEARWYSLYNDVSQHASSLTPGKFSVFPSISGCDKSRWEYTGEFGYIDVLPDSVLSVSSSLNSVYNIKWKRNKTNINEYLVSSFSDSLIISLKLFGGGICDRIVIESGYDVGTEFAGYITKCSILIDGVSRFSIDNNINSVILADFSSISFSTVDIVIEEVKQVSNFVFNDVMLTGNVVFINYVKVLSASSSRTFNDTLCNIYEFDSPIKLESIDTSKIGTCSLDYYYSGQYADGCIDITTMGLSNPPNNEIVSILAKSDNLYSCGFAIDEYTVDIPEESMTGSVESWKVYIGDVELYEEFFYLQGTSTSIGLKFFKETVFEVGTYYENFGTNTEWAITDELVLNVYSSSPVSSFYVCIGNKDDGIYYRWDFSLSFGWNNLRFNFYGAYVTKYSFNVLTTRLLFNDLTIFNVWCGGTYQHGDGFVVLDNIFVDRSSVPNTLSSHKDAFYAPVNFESESGSIHMDYKSYWNSDGLIFGDMLSDKTILSVFGDGLCFSLVNKISGKFVLGVYSYEHDVRTVKTFGYASKFDINDTIKLRLDWSCRGNQFSSDLYVNGSFTGRTIFSLVETDKLKVTGIMVGGGSVYITSIYNSLSLCGQLKHIKVYSSNVKSKIINDRLFIKYDGNYKNLVDNSPLYIGEIQPSDYVTLSIKYEGKSKELNQLNLKVKWAGIY
jgi:hypothetical protein